MRIMQEPAYVLHQHAYSETSLLLELFTRLHGKVGVVAKGARRPRSPLHAALIPFQPLSVSFTGRGELPTLTSAEPLMPAPVLAGPLLFCGLYLNELLQRLLHRHDPHERLFEQFSQALNQLPDSATPEPVLRLFEKRLLEEIGYGLVLEHEADSGAVIAPASRYRYLSERGPMPYTPGGEGIPVHGSTLLALSVERLEDTTVLQEAKQLLRALLARQLGDRPLASRDLFQPAAAHNTLE